MTSETAVAPSRPAAGTHDDGAPGGATPPGASEKGLGRAARARARWRAGREKLDGYPRLRVAYKVGVALAGVVVIAVGLVLVPLPGPGWLIVFVGVAVLGTEFPAAHRVTQAVRRLAHRLRLRWRAWRANRAAARA
ncbi:TIGR02611 family protein [Frigoribacterium sp. ACAM 257]|uniref:PGPGW domain-containing protein n=1 Tax=Frigoribacterium sp. ACAM 257 TaxID=2508998 RepID=UPI0011B9AA05|nr:PGPGW domain-containing protein [Frigoribacterium sp. ACAM 257]TWX40880.1 TIGR02611 family protein [Frigoribacterium sp. ACAM 257]